MNIGDSRRSRTIKSSLNPPEDILRGHSKDSRLHFLSLDGLRGVAAIAVLLYHQRTEIGDGAIGHGYLAVDFFFVLSGFVIAHAYEGRLRRGLSLYAFAKLRAIRLFPLLAVGAVLGGLSLAVTATSSHDFLRIAIGMPFAAVALPAPLLHPFTVNMPAWSLFVELVANFVFAIVVYKLTNRAVALIILVSGAALIVMAFEMSGVGVIASTWADIPLVLLRVSFPFFVGVQIARARHTGRLINLSAPLPALAFVLLLALLLPPFYGVASALYDIFCVAVLFPAIVVAGSFDRPTSKVKRTVAFSAELSYPLYILHLPLVVIWGIVAAKLQSGSKVLIGSSLIVVLCYAMGRWFDEPVRAKLRQRLTAEQINH